MKQIRVQQRIEPFQHDGILPDIVCNGTPILRAPARLIPVESL
jgi:hypothetical protein